MSLFSVVQGAQAIIWESCVYKQVGIYRYQGFLFVKHKGGFIRMAGNGQTEHPKVTWKEIDGVEYTVNKNRLELIE